jgi:hypothetical protein
VLELVAIVDGREVRFEEDRLLEVEAASVRGDDGEGARDAFPLRALVHALVGPTARVTELVGEEGRTVEIAPAAWDDARCVPVLKVNRKGQLKLQWTDEAGAPVEGEELRKVQRIVVRSA